MMMFKRLRLLSPLPEVEAEPFVAIKEDVIPTVDARQGVNEDSLLPQEVSLETSSEQIVPDTSADSREDRASSERALARLSKLKNLDTLVQNLDEGSSGSPDTAIQPATDTDISASKPTLTDPVVLCPG